MKTYLIICGNKKIYVTADNIVTLHNGDFRFYYDNKLIAHFSSNCSWAELSDNIKEE